MSVQTPFLRTLSASPTGTSGVGGRSQAAVRPPVLCGSGMGAAGRWTLWCLRSGSAEACDSGARGGSGLAFGESLPSSAQGRRCGRAVCRPRKHQVGLPRVCGQEGSLVFVSVIEDFRSSHEPLRLVVQAVYLPSFDWKDSCEATVPSSLRVLFERNGIFER